MITYEESFKLNDSVVLAYSSIVPDWLALKDEVLKDFIYEDFFVKAEYDLANIEDALKKKAKREFHTYQKIINNNLNYIPSEKEEWIAEHEVKIESAIHDYLIVSTTHYYCLGAVRGTASDYHVTEITYRIFDVRKKIKVNLYDVVNPSINWNQLIRSGTDRTVFRTGRFKGVNIKVDYNKDTTVEKIPEPPSFYFNKEKIYFLYPALDLIDSERCAVLEIFKNVNDMKSYLSMEFKNRMGIE